MKSWLWKLSLATAMVWFTSFGGTTIAAAPEDNPPGPGDRLQRLERRLDELAMRQEQMMRRLDAPDEQQPGAARQFGPRRQGQPPTPIPNLENARRPLAAPDPGVRRTG